MEEFIELNSEDCLQDRQMRELTLLAMNYISYFNNGYFIVVGNGTGNMSAGSYSQNSYRINYSNVHLRFIYDGLYLLLSDQSLYSDIGKSSHIMKIPSLKYKDISDYFEFKADLFRPDQEKSKFDLNRRHLHSFLYKIITSLLLFHECQHILNGHTLFFKSNNIRSENAVKTGFLSSLDLQTLEMDSDAGAIITLFDFLLQDRYKFDIPKDLKNEKDLLSSLVFASYFLFLFIPSKKYNSIEEMNNLTHPCNGFRFGMMIDTLSTLFLKINNPKLSEALNKIQGEILEDFKKTVLNVSSETINNTELQLYYSDESKEYRKKITYNWNLLRPKLEPYALRKLSPYTSDYIVEKNNYNSFMTKLYEFKMFWSTLLYSNLSTISQLKNQFPQLGTTYIKGNGKDDIALKLTPELIIENIKSYAAYTNEDITNAINNIAAFNASFLRTKVLYETYKLIEYYVTDLKLLEKLNSMGWYRILYVIATNSSLFDYTSKDVHFPKNTWKPDYISSIHWNGITIYDGQLNKNIHYTDKQVLDLLEYITYFFSENEKDFNVDGNKTNQ